MRVVCVCRDNMDYSRPTFDWIEDFKRRTGKEIGVIDPDLESVFCEHYDVVEYPTILVLDERGSVISMWRGLPMPLMDEVLAYLI